MNNFLKIFCFVAIAHLLAKFFDHAFVDQLTKPLLLPLLILFFLQSTSTHPSRLRLFFISALFFSWLGDVVLMFSDEKELFFILGLAFFLLTQLFYATVFFSWVEKGSLTLPVSIAAIIPFTAFGIFLLMKLLPHLGALFIPVIVYASAITLMGIASALTFKSINLNHCLMLVSGSLFFIVSDSLLAINKFLSPVPYSGFWVMLTYIIAQGIITKTVSEVLTEKDT